MVSPWCKLTFLFALDSIFHFRIFPQMSGGPSSSAIFKNGGGGGDGKQGYPEPRTHERDLLVIASLEVLSTAYYLGNQQCHFHFGCSDHPEKIFQSPACRVWALLPSFWEPSGEKGWGEFLSMHVFTWSQSSLQHPLRHKLC